MQKIPQITVESTYDTPALFLTDDVHPMKRVITISSTNTFPIKAGTILGVKAEDGKGYPYANANNDGTETAVGILTQDLDDINSDILANIAIHGIAYRAKMIGLDANAEADLKGMLFI